MSHDGGEAGTLRRARRIAPALAAVVLLCACSSAPVRPPGAGADAVGGSAAGGGAWTLPCGALACDGRTSYCEVIKTDAPELPSDYACRPLPEACRARASGPAPTCGCFPEGTRCDYCLRLDGAEGRGFRRMCVGGY